MNGKFSRIKGKPLKMAFLLERFRITMNIL